MIFEKGTKLLFNGDSITDVGRARPAGEAPGGLGAGYPNLVSGMLTAYLPGQKIRVVNTAVSGDNIRMMAARWRQDTLDHKPDWVSVMIGINDVWRHFDRPFQPEKAVGLPEYTETYRRLIEETLPHVKGMILMTPYYADRNLEDPMTAMVRRYAEAVRALAEEYRLVLCDTQKAIDKEQEELHHMGFSADRVHPSPNNPVGHFILARAFLESVGIWPFRD